MSDPRPNVPPVSSASPPGTAGSAEGSPSEQDVLGALLEDAVRERDQYLDLAKRAQADFENFRKRSATQVADAARKAKGDLARDLLPAIDSLERALEGAEGDGSLERGVAMVRDQLLEALKRAGVEAYDPTGERFDPTWHEALSTAPAAEGTESGVIVEVLDRGYRADGQVLRPARVVVAE
jgi:molecular chaperone GrpE